MFRPAALLAAVVAAALAAVTCAACGSTTADDPATTAGSAAPSEGGEPAVLSVVASTTVWGDIAARIGGDRVAVTSLIGDPSQDPHEFQPSGRDELAVARADVVIANGGGYDDFLSRMLSAVHSRATVVTAYVLAGKQPTYQPDNEHVWFDPDTVSAVAHAIAAALASRDPAGAADFAAAASRFDDSLAPIRRDLAAIAAKHRGAPVLVTEPLPLYLVAAAGLTSVTPAAFSDAMEEGIDVSPTQMRDVLDLIDGHRVALLLYNDQSASSQAEQVLTAARGAGVPVLALGEVLPAGEHYVAWVTGIVDELARLLDAGGAS